MKTGQVIGKVWATIKDEKIKGLRLVLMHVTDETGTPISKRPVVAVDTVNTHEGDLVYWVGGAEATFALDSRQIPSDTTIVGLIDRVDN